MYIYQQNRLGEELGHKSCNILHPINSPLFLSGR
jgi:hypothetical protein